MDSLDGAEVYQIDIVSNGTDLELTYLPVGTLVMLEQEITVEALPTAVLAAIAAEYPTGLIEDAEMITRGDVTEYKVEVEVGSTDYEILLDANGNILAVDQDEDDQDEDDED
ncbi:PepSY-like domain-containing protein [Candidatus Neomarinimicrobiota bacterium]